jgi:hypothetical protein
LWLLALSNIYINKQTIQNKTKQNNSTNLHLIQTMKQNPSWDANISQNIMEAGGSFLCLQWLTSCP